MGGACCGAARGAEGQGGCAGGGRGGERPRALIVLVLGPVLQDAGELHVVEVALLVDGRLPVHLIHLLVGEPVSHGGQQLTQMVLMNEACRDGGGVVLAGDTVGGLRGRTLPASPKDTPAQLSHSGAARGLS